MEEYKKAAGERLSEPLLFQRPGGLYHARLDGNYHFESASAGLCAMLGYQPDEFAREIGTDYIKMILARDQAHYAQFARQLSEGEQQQTIEYRLRCKNGTVLEVSDTMESHVEADGTMWGYAAVTNITRLRQERRLMQQQNEALQTMYRKLQASDRRLRVVSSYAGILFYEYDLVNQRFLSIDNAEHLLGYRDEDLLALSHARRQRGRPGLDESYDLFHPDDRKTTADDLRGLRQKGESHCEVRVRKIDGSYVWCLLNRYLILDDEGQPEKIIGCLLNNERGHHLTDNLKKQLSREALTGLYNKESAFTLIAEILRDRAEHRHAMLMLDLDNFKQVNDQLGHKEGDRTLVAFASLLKSIFRAEDVIARYGGDEFLIFMPNVTSEEAVRRKANRLLEVTRVEIGLQNAGIDISTSIGIAFSEKGLSMEELFNHADKALYDAKHKGKSRVTIYDGESLNSPVNKGLESIERSLCSGVAILKVHPDWIETAYHSKALPQLIGYADKEFEKFCTQDIWAVVYHRDKKKVREIFQKCLKENGACDTIFRLQHKDGGVVWVQALAEGMGCEDECPVLHVVFNNVSKHIALYNDVLDESDQMIHLSDRNTYEVLYANTAAAKNTGREPGSYLGKTCYEWLAHRYSPCVGCHAHDSGICEKGAVWGRHSDVNGRYYTIKTTALDWQGRAVIIEYITDNTEIHQAQEVMDHQKEQLRQEHETLNRKYAETVRSLLSAQDGYICLMQFDLTQDRLLEVQERQDRAKIFRIGMNHDELRAQVQAMLKRPGEVELFDRFLDPSVLQVAYELGETEHSFEVELRAPERGLVFVHFMTTLRQEPNSGHIMAFIRVGDITREHYTRCILQRLAPQSYDSVGVIDTKTGMYFCYLGAGEMNFVWQADYDKALADYLANNADAATKPTYQKYQLQAITKALRHAPAYELYGNVCNPDGSAANKKVVFSYLHNDESAILYSRQDITDILKKED